MQRSDMTIVVDLSRLQLLITVWCAVCVCVISKYYIWISVCVLGMWGQGCLRFCCSFFLGVGVGGGCKMRVCVKVRNQKAKGTDAHTATVACCQNMLKSVAV